MAVNNSFSLIYKLLIGSFYISIDGRLSPVSGLTRVVSRRRRHRTDMKPWSLVNSFYLYILLCFLAVVVVEERIFLVQEELYGWRVEELCERKRSCGGQKVAYKGDTVAR